MTTWRTWVQGARPRTLPAAIAPVAVGAGVAVPTSSQVYRPVDLLVTLLCAVVALALQVAVNYANDYSDGVRGTDADRVGPVRLVGQGLASPEAVKRAAVLAGGVAALAGLLLVYITDLWWLLLVGAAALLAAWGYTGGPMPYGYRGFGEVMVFVFFGVVGVVGTATALTGRISLLAVVMSIPVGLLACALLVVNNLRDIPSDTEHGKRTLATKLGDAGTRHLFVALIWVPFVWVAVVSIVGAFLPVWPELAVLALVTFPMALAPTRAVRKGATAGALVPVLAATARLELLFSLLLAIGVALSN